MGMNHRFSLGMLSEPKIIKFLSAGVLNTVFGYSVYAALLYIKVPYLVALLAATVAGVVFNYMSFGRIVFNGRGGWLVFGKFVVAYGLIYLANAILLRFLMEDFLLSPYLGQIICIPIGVLLSWLLMNYWVYKNE
jgi:putative flippase GtrA